MAIRLHRRGAIKLGAAAGLGYFFTGPAASVVKAQGSNERLHFAGIGVGGKGQGDISQAGSLGEVIAICDVDESKRGLGWATDKWKDAAKFTDYRKLFEDAALVKKIDAVTVSTADHHHAFAAVLAMRAGKHVYCQKPLTRTVFEARTMMEVAKKYKVCTQMGNQGSAATGLRRAVELIEDGLIGDVTECHIWTDRPREYWKQAPDVTARPKESPAPKTLAWDVFVGPSPERPHANGYTPFLWRGWWDFGTGAIGDMACHTANMAFRALKLAHPTKVSAQSGEVNPETAPAWAHVTLEFPKRGDLPPVVLHWYEGAKDKKKVLPPEEIVAKAVKANGGKPLANSGSILIGTKGMLYSPSDYGSSFVVTPGELLEGKDLKKLTRLPTNNADDQGQKNEWVEAIKANKPALAYSNFDYASLLTEAFLLGNVAVRTGKPFTWDGEACRATDLPEAAALVRRQYRAGWDLIGYNAKASS